MLIAYLFERWNYIKLHIRIFRLFSVAWVMIRPVLQICSAIVKISSELVKISSELVEISSELIWFSSETFSTIGELLKISTLENTTVSEIRTPALCLNQQNRELLCFNFIRIIVKTDKRETSVNNFSVASCFSLYMHILYSGVIKK